MTPIQKKRNQQVVKALKLNTKKKMLRMRDENNYRCCLCVAEDTAIDNGLNLEKCGLGQNMPRPATPEFFGWENANPDLLILKNAKTLDAARINDSPVYVPHRIIAEFFANTFTRKRFRLTKEAREYANKLVVYHSLTK